MKFQNTSESFRHGQLNKIGILLTNLGTPEAPTTPALRNYLGEFLSDPRVVEVPRLLWWCILHLVILRIRPRRSAAAYRSIWSEAGSPLAVHTRAQAEAVKQRLKQQYGEHVHVDWAMRYGQPSIASKLQNMMENGVTRLLVLPLYPQYSASTTASTFDAVAKDFLSRRWLPELRFISGYHDNEAYIQALANSITEHIQNHGRPEKLLFSYHGVPLRYLHKGDPYHCFCHQTTRLVADKLDLAPNSYLTSFQSRFGREPWLEPYTDETLKQLARDGVSSVAVICPGFSADCLETIEEIEEENKAYFLESGGKAFHYISALNSREDHIEALTKLCLDNTKDWFEKHASSDIGALVQERYNRCKVNRLKGSTHE